MVEEKEIQNRLIEEEMKENYIDYAMSVIMQRALPDVKDGLKPVHRRILYSMYGMGLYHNKPFVKSARIVGECFKYHPHGDTSIYDALVRMAQDFSLRYTLIKGHGNFGSIEGFRQAQMRYTEAKLGKIGEELLVDINKDTVDFIPNFDGSLKEPVILPGKIPNLLINGSSGIAVGMATNIPSHNIREIIDAIVLSIDNPEISVDELMKVIKGPDFPTGAYICGRQGIKSAYNTGRGRLLLRAKTVTEKNRIIVTEIPYQVNKSLLLEGIADLVRDKRVQGIVDLRDESNIKGMRIVIELRANANSDVVLNQLFKHSQLQTTFGVTMLALVNGVPKVLTLKDLIRHYIIHRKNVVTRRTKFELAKAEERAHILAGLKIALANIDPVVKMIKSADSVETAGNLLMRNFRLTKIQAQAILDMRLQRLTSLEQSKIRKEYDDLIKLIAELKAILASEAKIFGIIKKELLELKEKYGDDRRTEVIESEEEIVVEDLIPERDVVIIATHSGYVKQLPLTLYRQQRRGGRGIIGTETKEEDIVKQIFVTNNHNYLLFFTNKGKVHWLKAHEIPEASRYSKGKALVNLLHLKENELVTTIVPIAEFDNEHYLLMATKNGLLKKTALSAYANPRKGGIIGINLRDNDELVEVRLTPGNLNMLVGTANGLAVKFKEKDVRAMGRGATGVRGVRLIKDRVIGMEVGLDEATLLTVTENGYGKRTKIADYRLIRRGGKGVINIKTSARNGKVVGIKTVFDDDEVLFITAKGVVIRIGAKGISTIGRNTQGVRIMKLKSGDKVTRVARVVKNNG